MQRKIIYWKLRDRELQLGERTLVMGILNITPDSFSDGGRFIDPEKAYGRALELQEAGADIIDIGAESTRPGAEPVSADEEWRRLVPLLRRLRGNLSVPVSLDTYKSETAERALAFDVHILNDPSGLTFDPALAKVAASENLGLILNHMRGRPEQWAKMGPLPDAIGTVTKELDAAVNRARHAGVDRQRIVVDPGIGFGKRKEQNSELIAQLGYLSKLDLPILVGASRKGFLAQGTEQETMFATAAAVAVAVMNGAHIVRVHDVKEMLAVVRIADELARSGERAAEEVAERPAARRAPAKMQSWEEEKPKPTRPPMKRLDPPIAVTLDRAMETSAATAPSPDTAPKTDQPGQETPAEVEMNGSEANENPPEQKRPIERTVPKRPVDTRDYPPSTRPYERSNDRPPRRDYSQREERPAAGGQNDRSGGRPPFRRDERSNTNERPPFRREDRPAAGSGDRPYRKPVGDRPFEKPGGDRPFGKPFGKPGGDRPFKKTFGKPGDRPFSEGPRGDRPPRDNRPGGDRPSGDRPAPWQQRSRPGDRPQGDRPQGDRPQWNRPQGDRPQGDRPNTGRPPSGNFSPPRGGRPGGARPGGARPGGARHGGDRPGGDRPGGGRPPRSGPGGPRKPFRRD